LASQRLDEWVLGINIFFRFLGLGLWLIVLESVKVVNVVKVLENKGTQTVHDIVEVLEVKECQEEE
jgi:hypothetical protein